MNRLVAIAVLVLLALSPTMLFAGGQPDSAAAPRTSQDGPRSGGTLDVGLHIPLPTLDWQSTVGHPLPHVMGHVFEGLFGFGSDFAAYPELAESAEPNGDGTVWTIALRRGVLFHNGEEMKADDVVASLERWRKVGPKGPSLDDLSKFEIVDDYTVRMHFNSPMGRFLLLILGSDENKAVIMPREIAEASTTAGELTGVIGTGPYRFDEYREDNYARLVRFDDYVARDDAPNYQTGRKDAYVDEIVFWIVPESSTRVAGLESGEYDVITLVPDSEYSRLQETSGVVPVKNGPGVLIYLMFNQQTGPTADLNFRKAVQATIDSGAVARGVVADPDFMVVDPSFYPPESAYNTDVRSELYNQVNLAKAREYLAQSGYSGEEVIYQVIATNDLQRRTGQSVVAQLQKVGINAVLQTYDLSTWVARRRDPNALNMYNSGGYWIDPSLWSAEFSGTFPSPEVGFYSDETQEVFRALARETDFQARFELGEELQRLFYDKVATVNLGYIYRLVARSDTVVDPEGNLSLGNLTLHGVWLNE